MDINQYAANKLKELRMSKRLTQEELAEDLGITQQQIARYENNQRKFKQDFLFKLAEYFEISINDFFPNFDSHANDAVAEEMGTRFVSETQLSILTKLSTQEIRDITTGKNKLPNPNSLIKIGDALQTDKDDESLAFYFLMSAGYVEDPQSADNELYHTGIRYLLSNNERKILCNFLSEYWNSQQSKHVYEEDEIYNTLFEEDKETFSKKEVQNMMTYDNKIIYSNVLAKLINTISSYNNNNNINLDTKFTISSKKNNIDISDLSEKDKEQIEYMVDLMRKNNQNKGDNDNEKM